MNTANTQDEPSLRDANSIPLAPDAVRYLSELELLAKQRVGLVPEDLLAAARAAILERQSELQTDSIDYAEIVSVFGTPPIVVDDWDRDIPKSSRKRAQGKAPGWRICCTSCGRSAPAAKMGITRLAASSHHKYIAGTCSQCGGLRPMRLIKDLDRNNLTLALGASTTPSELRRTMHKPYQVASLLFLPLALLLVAALIANLLLW